MRKTGIFVLAAAVGFLAAIGAFSLIGSPFTNCMDRVMRTNNGWSPGQVVAYCNHEKRYQGK